MKISSRITTRTTANPRGTYTFSRTDRLRSSKQISLLFEKGRRLDVPPLRILYLESGDPTFPAQMAISVPKRLHRNAVDRNLLKRRIRESYRLKKPAMYERLGMHAGMLLVLQFRGREVADFQSIDLAVEKGISLMLEKMGI